VCICYDSYGRLWIDADFEECYVLESDATYAPGLPAPESIRGLESRRSRVFSEAASIQREPTNYLSACSD
jgi:hypothetical protein